MTKSLKIKVIMIHTHALRMFSVNRFGDIGLVSGRALHQIGIGVYMSRHSIMAEACIAILL